MALHVRTDRAASIIEILRLDGAASGPVFAGGQLFNEKGCEFCHTISRRGGRRGPNLTDVGDRLTADDLTIRIMNGGYNMPAFAGILKPQELNDLVAFLSSRKLH